MKIRITDHLVRAVELSTAWLTEADVELLGRMAIAYAVGGNTTGCVMKHECGFVVFVGEPTFDHIKAAGASEQFVSILDETFKAGDIMYLTFHTDLGEVDGEGSDSRPDVKLTADQLSSKYAGEHGTWGEHPDYPREDWQHEVADGDTLSGYWAWVVSSIERDLVC